MNRSVCQSWFEPGPLEATHLVRVPTRGHFLQLVAGLLQHPGHRRRAGRQRRAAHQHITDPLAAPIRIRLLEHQDGPLGQIGQLAALATTAGPVHQPGRTLLLKALLPHVERVLRNAHDRGEVGRRQPAAAPGIQDQQPLFRADLQLRCGGLLDQPLPLPHRPQSRRADRLGKRFGRNGFLVLRLASRLLPFRACGAAVVAIPTKDVTALLAVLAQGPPRGSLPPVSLPSRSGSQTSLPPLQ